MSAERGFQGGGMQALGEIRAVDPDASVIILTAYVEIPKAVEAMRLGAYDYLTKPFVKDELVLTVQRALERRRLVARVEQLERESGPVGSLRRLMGPSAQVTRLIAQCLAAAESSDHLTIEGEPGTGKELVARVIHEESLRRGRPSSPWTAGRRRSRWRSPSCSAGNGASPPAPREAARVCCPGPPAARYSWTS